MSIPFLHPHYSFLNSTFLLILSSPFYSFPIYSSLFFHLLSMYNLYPFSPIYCPSPLLVSPLSTHSSLPFSLGVFSLPFYPLTTLPSILIPSLSSPYLDPLTTLPSILIPSLSSPYLDPLTTLPSIIIPSLPPPLS